jgi:hypothetical protein
MRLASIFGLIGSFTMLAGAMAGGRDQPRRMRYLSRDKSMQVEVLPADDKSKVAGACRARLVASDDRGQRKVVWARFLANERAPGRVMVTDDGNFTVTIDEWPRESARHPLVIYDAMGRLVRHFAPMDFMDSRPAQDRLKKIEKQTWTKDARLAFDRDGEHLVIEAGWDELIVVELKSGRLIRPESPQFHADSTVTFDMEDFDFSEEGAFWEDFGGAPLPDPDNPIDYLAWLNDQYSTDISSNAAPLLHDAADMFLPFDGPDELMTRALRQRWDKESMDPVRRWLQDNDGALSLFRKAAELPDYSHALESDTGSMIDARLPNLGSIRTMGRALLADANRALAEGDLETALANYRDVLEVGEKLNRAPTLIERLVGTAMASGTYDALAELPSRVDANTFPFDAVRDEMNEISGPEAGGVNAVEGERTFYMDMLQRVFRRNESTGEIGLSSPTSEELSELTSMDLPPEDIERIANLDFDETVELANRYYDQWSAVMNTPYRQAREMANLLEEEIASESNPLLSHMIPKLSRVRQLQAVAESRRRGGLLSLALFEYRQKHGLFPDRLEELSDVGAGGILNDPLTDAPMIYRKNDDGFQLYSAGVDGVDDGGVGDDFSEVGHDHVFWPPQNTE